MNADSALTQFPLAYPVLAQEFDYPSSVSVYEVGPRDGLQAEDMFLPTADKIEFIRGLIEAGISNIEVSSFVSPKWIPQLRDAKDVVREVTAMVNENDHVALSALAPNMRGVEDALESGIKKVAVVVSASETFAWKNLNSSREDVLHRTAEMIRAASAAGAEVRAYISMCFGDPWEGEVPSEDVVKSAAILREAGADTIVVSDTIGVATPGHVSSLLRELSKADIAASEIALHFHDTYGQALANVLTGLLHGVSEFDSAAAGLGKCPYADGATGNLATEDLVWMLSGMGYDTGIDLDKLVKASHQVTQQLGLNTITSNAATARLRANNALS